MRAEPIVYLNGEYKPASAAGISVFDQGFLLGDGIFDVVSAWKGQIFKLDEHIERFFQSLKAARLVTELSRGDWRDIILETVRRNELQDASIRFIATRGVPLEVVGDPREYRPTIVVWAVPYLFLADDRKRELGVRLHLSHLRGFSPDMLDPRLKTLSRLHFQLARLEAAEAGYDDVLLLNHLGYVAEAPASNIFMVKRGILYTPGEEVLPGITRQTILELAEENGIESREMNLTAYDLFGADEIFTCSTAGGPLPVREVAGRSIDAPIPGPVTERLRELYWDMRESGRYGTAIYPDAAPH
jgi:branched-chain amino acid aminotransferase